MMFKVSVSTAEYRAAMAKLSRDQIPRAQAAALNAVAKVVDQGQRKNLRERFTLRNKYTENSLKVSEARPKANGTGYAEVGSISPYLPIQETGGVEKAKSRRVPIPTVSGARLGSKEKIIPPRMRMNRLGALGASGTKFFYAPFRKPGIFYRKGRGKRARLIMVRDLSRSSVKVKPTHWHTDAVKKYATRSLMEKAFVREARRIIGAAQ